MDLGTSNTAVARWDAQGDRPKLVELAEVCRIPGGGDPLEAPRLVPSATHMELETGFWANLGNKPFFLRRYFWGRHAWIGRQALERNATGHKPAFARSFKSWLGRASLVPLAKADGNSYTAREVASSFLRELFGEVYRETGERIRDLVITNPVDAYEAYRAELSQICTRLGVKRLRFVDEPVAAALGYGLGMARSRKVLVVDFGAGTLDLALVDIQARELEEGRCRVVAKAGVQLGGNDVDRWLLNAFCARLEYRIPKEDTLWQALMLDEARRVKEAVFVQASATFHIHPPDDYRSVEARVAGPPPELSVSRTDLEQVLKDNRMREHLESCLREVMLAAHGEATVDDVEDVLMVGGSTLLPGVYPAFEAHFGRDRVRAWQPFEAVAYGAAAFAAGKYDNSDIIVHDYAILTHDRASGDPEHVPIIRRGTRFPTARDAWRGQLVPTCALGVPEDKFKLVICEIGAPDEDERHFGWDTMGRVHKLKGGVERLVVPLNATNPVLGLLQPAHKASDHRARLDVMFGVDENRWLTATVIDLHTKKTLIDHQPVVRLL